MARKLKTIPITEEDVAFIFNDNLEQFHSVTSNCFCAQCQTPYESTIVNYKILLNELYDILLKGFCMDCGHTMGRYLETGEVPATARKAEAIWKTHKTLKELKIKKQK